MSAKNILMAAAGIDYIPPSNAVIVSHQSSPYITTYPWSQLGFGTKYSNPSSLPTSTVNAAVFNKNRNAVAIAGASIAVQAYAWSKSGFGTKYSSSFTINGNGAVDVNFNPRGTAVVAAATQGPPDFVAYQWSNSSGFGTKYSDPSTFIDAESIKFSNDGNYVLVTGSSSPSVAVYPWNDSTGFGTKYSDPSTLPPTIGRKGAWSKDNDAIVVVGNPAGGVIGITAYPWSSSGFGTKYSDPSTVNNGIYFGVAFNPVGNQVVLGDDQSPYISAYEWNSSTGFGTKYSNPSTLPGNTCRSISFANDGSAIAAASSSSPYVLAYKWSSSGFGVKFTDPSTLPPNIANSVAFN